MSRLSDAWVLLVGCVAINLTAAAAAVACPVCSGGAPVRAAVFGPDFMPNLGAAVLPFALFLVIAAVVHGRPPHGGGRP